jgi:cytochrome c oxidase subunit 2
MGLRVIADTLADYTAWVNDQLADAPEPTTDLTRIGQQRFQRHCAACHTIRGTPAGGAVGPDLTHLMSRTTIAAGILTNTPANLGGWIANPQSIKPGAQMPNIELSGPELHAIETYLLTLG